MQGKTFFFLCFAKNDQMTNLHEASSMQWFVEIGDTFQVLKMFIDFRLILFAPSLIWEN